MTSPSDSGFRRFVSRAGMRLFLGLLDLSLATGVTSVVMKALTFVPEIIGAAVIIAVSLAAYTGFVRLLERRRVTELSPSRAPELLVGLLLGAALFSATIGVLALLGCYHVDGRGTVAGMLKLIGPSAVSGVCEELIIRGVLFRISEELVGTWGALGISAALFGLLHLPNPNATLLGAIAIALEAGVLLAAAYLVSRRLWVAIGLHAAWNFVQGGIFSVAISGHPAEGLLRGSLSGPEWLSGGSFGAEASPVAVAVCLLAAVPLLLLARRMGKWKRAPWGKRQ